jgi:integrase
MFTLIDYHFMNFVEPIRDRKKIAQIKNQLRGQERFRDLLLFTVGVNTALRISDLLQLRIGQFLDERGRYKRRFWIHEQKRNKRHEVVINQSIQEAPSNTKSAKKTGDRRRRTGEENFGFWLADCGSDIS